MNITNFFIPNLSYINILSQEEYNFLVLEEEYANFF